METYYSQESATLSGAIARWGESSLSETSEEKELSRLSYMNNNAFSFSSRTLHEYTCTRAPFEKYSE